jgi:MYXO-CTERM domain-containing protein
MSHGCAFGTTAMENKAVAKWPAYMVDSSAARNRAMQWLLFLENATGELYYETALQLPNSWSSIFDFGGNGDGTMFYPGQTSRIGGSTEVPLPSIRLKQIRQGMQDYEWLKKVADAGDPAFARETARLLIPKAYEVSDEGATYEAARLRLIGHWMKLTGHADDPDFVRCIPSDDPGGAPLCPSGRFWSSRPLLGKVGCSSAQGVPSALAVLGVVAAAALRRLRKR